MNRTQASLAVLCLALFATVGCASTESARIRAIATNGAPKANGPYSQGVVVNGFLFTAGQLPRDPVTSKLVEGDISVQTNRVLDNLESVLRAAGCSFQDVVKVTVFMADLEDFAKMNDVFASRFGANRPARTTVQVSKLNSGARLEIDLVARIPR